MADYMATIEAVFDRYGIPAYVSRRSDILEKPVLSLLTGVLASISGGYEYEDMFRWLKTGPRRYHGGGVRCAGKLCPEVGNSRPDVAAGGGLDGKSGRIRRAVE